MINQLKVHFTEERAEYTSIGTAKEGPFFKPHAIRLMSSLTVPTNDLTWRGLISARLSNIRVAWKLYLAHQKLALKTT